MENITNIEDIVENKINIDDILLYFQPITTADFKINSYECLARIHNHSNISPSVFIGVLKKNGLYHKFTQKVIDLSFYVFKRNKLSFSINLDFEDIMNVKTITYLVDKIHKQNIQKQLTIEILESKIKDYSQVSIFTKMMKNLGVKIAIDDFGSDYCNFINIVNLCPNIIKIDGSIISVLEENINAQIIVKSIANMAKDLNIDVIAEYIENRKIYQIAHSQGVKYFQGFYLAKPKPSLHIKKEIII